MSAPIWTPTEERRKASNMSRYMKWLADHGGPVCKSWEELYDWSITDIDAFWESLWTYAEIIHSRSYDAVRTGDETWNTDWFPGARLNFAENLLRYSDDRTAIVSYAEGREPVRLTYRELRHKVAACAAGLRALGVGPGDRVAAMIPNISEAVIAMLATTSLGAIWSSCSPDFGFGGVLDRFGQIRPKVLVSADGYRYAGKTISSLDRVARVAEELPDLERVIIVEHIRKPSLKSVPKSMLWTDLLAEESSEPVFEQLPFDHPVYIMFSSGTTGKPKCIVHGAGGTLIQHAKEHLLHTDLRRDDVITYFTTCGWMMWNWLVSALAGGSTVLLYEGSPAHPSLSVLWSVIEEEGVTVFGTSPKFLTICEDRDLIPRDNFDLSSLRTILSTGAPLSEQNFKYVYESVKEDLQLASISGGTDIISCFMLGNPLLPVYPGEIQSRGLGMKVEVFNDSGEPVTDEVGELVCTAPFPSRPVSFWDDPDHAKFRAAYFDLYPKVWRHGDYIRITPHGGIVVYGRSDATLNPGGVRIGTAEIYGPVEAMEEIVDSIAVGQQWENDVRVILFVVMAEGVSLDDILRAKIRGTIRSQRTPRHVPAKIIAVPAIPHTLNGKKVELAVTHVIHGREATNRDALANPDALDYFSNLAELTQP